MDAPPAEEDVAVEGIEPDEDLSLISMFRNQVTRCMMPLVPCNSLSLITMFGNQVTHSMMPHILCNSLVVRALC